MTFSQLHAHKIAVLGAGSWGLTLAWLLAAHAPSDYSNPNAPTTVAGTAVPDIWLWDRNALKIEQFQKNREIPFPVSVTLPESVHLTHDLTEAIDQADIILLAVSSVGTRQVASQLAALQLPATTVIVNASKGIELPSLKTMWAVVSEVLPKQPYATLSGPNLAKEILRGLPTAGVVATVNPDIGRFLQLALSRENRFRLYTTTDVLGVELGAALKNVFAIASGYMQAKQLGENARAALITRGLAEMTRFSVALGADEQTLYGLSGLGDLLATCNSPLSRNFQVGFELAKGHPLDQILADLKVTAEGVNTTHAVSQLAERRGWDAPIVKEVELALRGDAAAAGNEQIMIRSLMGRKLKAEALG
ncbi:MAG: NAD(P)H-dependent glycerol-3-phosphate dehydrogenase [Vampirovibrionales bacterium]|nr:NAD(P)H-dependent glycerol-3-phosphate dehydrogenase [Vampirovibrionales bacterium]